MNRPDLADRLEDVLQKREGRTDFELSRALLRDGVEVSHRSVSTALFRSPERFRRDQSSPPRWYLVRRIGDSAPLSPRPIIDRVPALYAWQAEALKAWEGSDRRGVVEAVTGAGKTILGVSAIREAARNGAGSVVLVPTTPLLEQWRERLLDQLPGLRVATVGGGSTDDPSRAQVVISTVQSAARRHHMLLPPDPLLLVADECHRYGARTFSKALLPAYGWRLGLTATYARSDAGLDKYLRPFFGETCFQLTYERALREEVVSHFVVALLGVDLDPDSQQAYDENFELASRARRQLVEQYLIPNEPFGDFIEEVAKIASDTSRQDALARTCRTFLDAFAAYRTALAEAPAKIQALSGLAAAFRQADGALVFTESIDAANRAARTLRRHDLRTAAIHSEIDHAYRSRLLHRLRQRRVQVIAAPRVLDEGIDVPDADLAVIVAASRTRRQMIQRMGRILRKKAKGRRARFVILYATGTTEDPARGAHETFLEEATAVADAVWIGHQRQLQNCVTFVTSTSDPSFKQDWDSPN